MRLAELLMGMNCGCAAAADTEVTGVCSNSDKVSPGDVFVAVKGSRTDSHELIASAVSRGASAVICQIPPSEDIGVPVALVPDSRRALALAADNFYGNPSGKMRFIGITGTNGKTTTSYMVYHILQKMGLRAGVVGTNGSRFGDMSVDGARTTPEAEELYGVLAEFAHAGCTHLIMEASSQGLDQRRCDALHFDAGVFLNISPEHLDYHGDMDRYLQAKLILSELSSACVVNADEPVFAGKFGGRCVTFSRKGTGSDYSAENESSSLGMLRYDMHCPAGSLNVSVPICGRYNVYNSLAAIAACRACGIPETDSVRALSDFKGVRGRFELVYAEDGFGVIIDYAHTPDSLRQVLTTARDLCHNKLILVFGCGGDRDKTKRPIMGRIAAEKADSIYVTDDNPRTEDRMAIISDILAGVSDRSRFTVIPDRRDAIRSALSEASQGDIVLLAGKGHEQYQILGRDRVEFDEYGIVDEHFRHKRA